MRWVDISMAIEPGMPTLPGDPTLTIRPTRSMARGDAYDSSEVTLGSHTGTHVDPPSHFLAGGATIDQIDLDILNGPCRVHRISDDISLVGAGELREVPAGTERLLLKTRNSARWEEGSGYFPDFVAVSEAGAREALSRGIRLVGIDSLSVERDTDGTFPVHRSLLGGGVVILEGLQLSQVDPGIYQLGCLPIGLKGGDGAPARAVLSAV